MRKIVLEGAMLVAALFALVEGAFWLYVGLESRLEDLLPGIGRWDIWGAMAAWCAVFVLRSVRGASVDVAASLMVLASVLLYFAGWCVQAV